MKSPIDELKKISQEIRVDIIRMLTEAGSGHPGGSLSAVEILVALYFQKMRHRSNEPEWPERDRFVLSKGHAVPVQYAVLARAGYFDRDLLMTLRKLNSPLQGHPDRLRVPGIETSTGALGQGLSIAQGMALAGKLDNRDYRVYCLIGDGESQEGQVWETAQTAPRYKLDNLVGILDYNGGQLDDWVDSILPIEPVVDRWKAFGWHVIDINGHDIQQVLGALDEAENVKDQPTFIVARTKKGKGVSFMEADNKWHGVTPTQEEADAAIKEILAA